MAWIMPKKDKKPAPQEEATVGDVMTPTNIESKWILPKKKPKVVEAGPTPEEQALAESGAGQRALIGMGQRFRDIGLGAKQFAGMTRNLFPGEPSAWPEEVAATVAEETPFRRAIGKDPAAMAGGIGADIAMSVGPLRMFSSPVLGSALTGAALGGPLKPRSSSEWGDVLQEAGRGAGYGALGGMITSGGLSATAKGKNAAQGRFTDPETQARFEALRDWGIEGSYGDISQHPLAMFGENLTQYLPFSGRSDFLKRQAGQIQRALQEAPTRIAGPIGSSTKEDLGLALSKSVKDRYALNKLAASAMYDDVSRAATGAPPVTPNTLAASAAALKKDYPKIFDAFQDTKAVKRLDDIIAGTAPQKSTILDAAGKPLTKPPEVSFDDMRWLDKRLGAMIRQGDKQVLAGRMDPNAFRQLVDLQKALRTDVTDWSTSIGRPEIAKGIADANKFFVKNVVPFRENLTTRKIIRDRMDTDKIPPAMLKFDSPSLAGQTREFLTPEGQLAARHYLLQQAEKRAMDQALSPRLSLVESSQQRSLGETGPKFFTPDELAQVKSLEDMLHATRRSIQIASDPSESARFLSLASMFNPQIAGAGGLYSRIMHSPSALRYMTADPKFYSGTNPLLRLSEDVARRSGVGLGLGFEESTNSFEEPSNR